MTKLLEVSVDVGTLTDLIKTARAFTSTSLSATSHLHGVLIRADKETGMVHLTAENDATAISFSSDAFDIINGGTILVEAASLQTVLNTIQSGSRVQLTQKNNKVLHISSGRTKIDLVASSIDDSDSRELVPTIGNHDDNHLVILGGDLADLYYRGSVAYDVTGEGSNAVDNIFFKTVKSKKNDDFLFVGAIRNTGTSYLNRKVLTVGNFDLESLIVPSIFHQVVGFVSDSDLVTLSYGKDGDDVNNRQLHLHIYSEIADKDKKKKKGVQTAEVVDPAESESHALVYHIRFATSAVPATSHPFSKETIYQKLIGFVDSAEQSLLVDRQEFFRVMQNAASICRLNRSGQMLRIQTNISQSTLGIHVSGDTVFDDEIPLVESNIEDMEVSIGWGYADSLFSAYPVNEDGIMRISFFKAGENLHVIVLISENDYKKRGLPAEFLIVIPPAVEG